MNKIKRLSALLAILAVAGMVQIFISCSSDDDGGSDTPSSSSVGQPLSSGGAEQNSSSSSGGGDNPPLSSSGAEQELSSSSDGDVVPELSSSSGNDVPDLSSSSGGDVVPSSSSEETQGGESSITDSRDSKEYKTVQIGEQVWFAENLNYNASGSKCYDNLDSNCEIYGRLYDWETAKTVCPSGWHLPSKEEWDIMTAYIGVPSGWKLKATSGWKEYEGKVGGTDDYGFSALPGGLGLLDGSFGTVDVVGYFWSASENDSDNANTMLIGWGNDNAGKDARSKSYLLSVRCLKGEPTSSSSVAVSSSSSVDDGLGSITDSRDSKKYKIVQIGEQVWFAENLNYAVEGSKCGVDGGLGLTDDNTASCNAYGRLYNWVIAMKFEDDCISNVCSDQINTPHQGICPDGWHIPSEADWDALIETTGDIITSGMKLRTTSGWTRGSNNDATDMSGTDDFGFSALPGGYGSWGGSNSNSKHNSVGNEAYWWSAREDQVTGQTPSGYVYYTGGITSVRSYYTGKNMYYSIRCLKD